MKPKCYVVTVAGSIAVDTTIAVLARSEEEAAKTAIDRVDLDTETWLRGTDLVAGPTVSHVEEVLDGNELQYADQKHLVGPQEIS